MASPLESCRFDVKIESTAAYRIELEESVVGVPACLITNCDESGLQEFVDSHNKLVLCPLSDKDADCVYSVVRDGKLVSVLAAICLDGSSCCPAVVVRRKTLDDNLFTHGLRDGKDCVIYTSVKGYVCGEHFYKWIVECFISFIRN